MGGQVPVKDAYGELGKNTSLAVVDWSKDFKSKKREGSATDDSTKKYGKRASKLESGSWEGSTMPKDACNQPSVCGQCVDKSTRWYYNWRMDVCRTFTYSGCGGNANNFVSQNSREDYCRGGVSVNNKPTRNSEDS